MRTYLLILPPAFNQPLQMFRIWTTHVVRSRLHLVSLVNPSLLDPICKQTRRILVCAHFVGVPNSLDLAATLCLSVSLDDSCSVTTKTSEQLPHQVSLFHGAVVDA